jgi:hypothetical protein
MTRQRKITTAVSLRRREAAARRTQDAIGPSAEIERLTARIGELQRELALARITIRGLRRRIDDVEDDQDD